MSWLHPSPDRAQQMQPQAHFLLLRPVQDLKHANTRLRACRVPEVAGTMHVWCAAATTEGSHRWPTVVEEGGEGSWGRPCCCSCCGTQLRLCSGNVKMLS